MSKTKNITKQIKKDILNNNIDYDKLCDLILAFPEEVISAILSSYLYLFRNINNEENKLLIKDLNTLLNNYIKVRKNKSSLDLMYNKRGFF